MAQSLRTLESSLDRVKRFQLFTIALLLGIAYAANVGGMATIVGTATNLSLRKDPIMIVSRRVDFAFVQWLLVYLLFQFVVVVAVFSICS